MKIKSKYFLPTFILCTIFILLYSTKTVDAYINPQDGYSGIRLAGGGKATWTPFYDSSGQFSITVTSNQTKKNYVGPCGTAVVRVTVPKVASVSEGGAHANWSIYKDLTFQYGRSRIKGNSKLN
ncbi:MAG: hypothetical protein EOM50_02955 [Erysipelotrichia bacterium]|nr:hypothetical protein [Erysipelotrichia bacterium]NCC54111.1 hypothetical protein [Erysipelotrichia bacterium]